MPVYYKLVNDIHCRDWAATCAFGIGQIVLIILQQRDNEPNSDTLYHILLTFR